MRVGQKLFTKNGTQVCLLPVTVLNVTLGVYEPTSHKDRLAIDLAGGIGNQQIIAPYDGVFVWRQDSGDKTGVVFKNTRPVLCPDGVHAEGGVVAELWHDNDISDIFIGKTFEQGDIIYQEGNKGQGVTGIHVHLMVSFTPYIKGYPLVETPSGRWALKGSVHPVQAFFINDVIVRDGNGYDWKVYEEVIEIINEQEVEIEKPSWQLPIYTPLTPAEKLIYHFRKMLMLKRIYRWEDIK